jgi:hypothetical protein
MKNNYFILLFAFILLSLNLQALPPDSVNVTFRVNLVKESSSVASPNLVGDFQGWSTFATPLTSVGNSVYQRTVKLKVGSTYQYKFTEGTNWETIPAACAVGGNRSITVPAYDTVLVKMCFNSCTACMSNVTFNVDMAREKPSASGVHLAGDFQGWNASSLTMSGAGGDYSYQVALPIGDTAYYNFYNGTAQETVSGSCIKKGHRYVLVPSKDLIVASSCFSSCGRCSSNVTFQVDMTNESVGNGVFLGGNFQGWNATATPMTLISNHIYAVTIPVQTKDLVLYKFINGTAWENVDAACLNNGNRFTTSITGPDITMPVVCLTKCTACKTTGIEEHAVWGTFDVYPSVIRSEFSVRLASITEKHAVIVVKDIFGRTVKELYSGAIETNFNQSFNVDELGSGVYFVHVSNKGTQVIKRILVQK